MRIGIDARLYGPADTGIGRYTQNLVRQLAKIDSQNTYLIFGKPEIATDLAAHKNFIYIPLQTKVYSLAEQLVNPFVFASYRLDLLHVPHFNAPLLYSGKVVLTIHDLIKHISVGPQTSNLSPLIYYLKHFLYRFVVRFNLLKSAHIITPTDYWRDYLIKNFSLPPAKVSAIGEGVDDSFAKAKRVSSQKVLARYHLTQPFVIYTGNLYPHKNVNLAIQAVRLFNQHHDHQLQLAIASARSVFQDRFSSNQTVKLLGFVPDGDLATLYRAALALVQPSFIEGFGLTGLEAMAVGLPVVSSNSSCLPEVYGDAALYFDPYSAQDLTSVLSRLFADRALAKNLTAKGKARARLFSWIKMAKAIRAVYTSLA